MASTQARITQRAPQPCQHCSTKKLKCFKTVPCDQCLRLGVDTQCRREPIIVSKRVRRPRRSRREDGSPNKDASKLRQISDVLLADEAWKFDGTTQGETHTEAQVHSFSSLSPNISTPSIVGSRGITNYSLRSPSLSHSSHSSNVSGQPQLLVQREQTLQESSISSFDDSVLAQNTTS